MADKDKKQTTLQILLDGHYIDAEDVKKAEKYAKQFKKDATEYLLAEDIITKDLIGQAVAEYLEVSYADLNTQQPPKEQVLKIPEYIAKKYRVILFSEDLKNVTVTSDTLEQASLRAKMKTVFPGKKVSVAYSMPDDVSEILMYYRSSLDTRFSKIIKKEKRIAPEIIDEMIGDAISYRASDIHFEPNEKDVVVRFRVDGKMREAGRIPKKYYENILNRIKVQAHLRLDEHYATQDGSIRYKNQDVAADIRISIVPCLDGEKIVMRVLARYVTGLNMADVGLSKGNQKMLLEAAAKPFGMILVTGPTGSGKTTTLYSLLKMINKPDVNVTTIEDPVEYKIAGINQIQVNQQTNLTFAKGLRSIVRQDPDVILVGEIRDQETAEIAVNAALTGHLLLSTFHSNDAETSIPRLLDMGVEPFLLASTLELVIAQRLVRRICDHCRFSSNVSASTFTNLPKSAVKQIKGKIKTVYQGKGCAKCGHSGFHGRTAVFEFIASTPEMEDLILTNPSKQDIWKLAHSQGSTSMFEDGLQKVKDGVTTIEELLRVAEPQKD